MKGVKECASVWSQFSKALNFTLLAYDILSSLVTSLT